MATAHSMPDSRSATSSLPLHVPDTDFDARSSSDGAARPAVDIRPVLFTLADGSLLVALKTTADGSRLPRGVPGAAEPLDTAARRIIRETTGVQEQYSEQLYTISADDGGIWTVIVSYMALICSGASPAASPGSAWHDVKALPPLSDPNRMVVDYAVMRLRAKLGYTNVAFHLLPQTFALSELQGAYETILARRLDKRNFRRRVIASGILASANATRRDGSHRPAALYRFRSEHDPASYLTPPWAVDSDTSGGID